MAFQRMEPTVNGLLSERSDGRPVGVVVGVRNSLSEHEVTVERLAQLESQAQRGSAAKAVCTLERSAR